MSVIVCEECNGSGLVVCDQTYKVKDCPICEGSGKTLSFPVEVVDEICITKEIGLKYDEGKPKLSHMCSGFWDAIVETSKVYNFGGIKHGWENWKLVEEQRYKDACWRHLGSIVLGEDVNIEKDKEGNEHSFYHAAQLAWNALVLCWFALQRKSAYVD